MFVPRAFLDPFDVPKLGLLALGVGAALGARAVEWALGERLSGLRGLRLPAAFLAAPLLTAWLFSAHKSWAMLGAYFRFRGLVPYLLVICFGVLLAEACARRPLLLVRIVAGTGAVAGFYAFIQMLGFDPFPWQQENNSWASSTLGYSNFTGGFLAMTLPCAVYVWVVERRRLAMAATVFIAVGLILSNSQGGWAAGVAGIAVLAGELLRHKLSRARIAGLAVAGVAAVATAGLVVLGMADSSGRLAPATAVTRGHLWGQGLEMAEKSPFVGHGPDAFALEGMSYRPVESALTNGSDRADDPHSVPLAMLANAGIAGLLGFVGVFGWVVRRGRKAPREAAPFLAALAAYFAQSLVSIDELSLRVALWVALAGLAATTAPRGRDGHQRPPDRHRRVHVVAAIASACLVFVGSTWWAARFLAADVHAAMGDRLFDEGETIAARGHLETAVALRDESEYRIALEEGLAFAALGERGRDEELNSAMMAAFDHAGKFRDLHEELTRSYLMGSLAVFKPDLHPTALEAYQEALSLDPYNPHALAGASEVLVALGRSDDAVRAIEPLELAVEEQAPVFAARDVADALGALSMARVAAGDRPGAIAALGHASALDADACRVLLARELLTGSEASTSYRPDTNRLLLLRFSCDPSRYRAMVNLLPRDMQSSYE